MGLFMLVVVVLLIVILAQYSGTKGEVRGLRVKVSGLSRELGELRDRVARLGAAEAESPAPVVAPAPQVAQAPSKAEPAKPLKPMPAGPAPPKPQGAVHPPARPAAADRVVMPAPKKSPPPKIAARSPNSWVSQAFGGADWEAVIGGNWLNKLGALVLVVGIALLLAYSVAHLEPIGRVALGLAVSVAMLGTGVVLWRRERYRIFAEGLLGGGWAGLYFTTYAMHGLEAARIIDSPLLGTVLLFAVAVGMVGHSLHYRSQAITGLAYFIVFATLAISELSGFALVAGVPVVASLLYVAHRFGWERMAVAGLVLTYGSFLLRYNGLQATGSAEVDWAFGQVLILAYWLVFEAFDVLSLIKGRTDEIAYTLFPLNSAGFLGISIIEWNQASPGNLFVFFSLAGGAYVASAVLRGRFVDAPAGPTVPDVAVGRRLEEITYEAAIALAAALFALGIYLRFDGWQMTAAWLLEAQMLILAGLRLRQKFLRTLGSVVIVLPALRVVGIDLTFPEQLEIAGSALRHGTPVALLAATVLFVNRGLLRLTKSVRAAHLEHLYTYAASFILALIIAYEVPLEFAPLGWLALAVLLFESSVFTRLAELRYQAYAVAAIAWTLIFAATVLDLAPAPESVWTLLAPAALFGYGAATRMYRRPRAVDEEERQAVFDVASLLGSLAVAILIWHVAPAAWVAVGWLLLGLVLVEVGFGAQESSLRVWGHAALLVAFGRTFMANFANVGETFGVSHRLLTLVPMIAAYYYVALRLREARDRYVPMSVEDLLERVYLYLPVILGTVLIRFELGRAPAVIGWMVLALPLLAVGLRRDVGDFRFQAYVLAALVFVRAWATNFYVGGTILGVPGRLFAGIVVTAGLLTAYVLVRRSPELASPAAGNRLDGLIGWLDEHVYGGLSLMATVLGAVLLYYELGAAATAIGWMVLCLTLLAVGLRWDLVDFRLQAYVLAGVVFARAWAINFYLDTTLLGVPTRLFTGIAVTAGLFAAHFMMRRQRAIENGSRDDRFGALVAWADEHAASALSLLATVLLAAFLFYEVSGSLLTVAWGLQGTALLFAGFALRDRQLRLSGLVLLGVCTLKAFFYDFRELETVFRIFSFMVLGILLIAVSFVYSRYREKLKRLL